jgi:tRNA(Arg) A34 adenosine deaminase TadA
MALNSITLLRETAADARVNIRLENAMNLAHRSGIKSYHTGAIIFQTATPVGYGWSHYSELNLIQYPRSIHAELHAILRTAQRKDLLGATVYVANKNAKSGNRANAKPCETCQAVLFEVGIKEVYYTLAKGYGKMVLK